MNQIFEEILIMNPSLSIIAIKTILNHSWFGHINQCLLDGEFFKVQVDINFNQKLMLNNISFCIFLKEKSHIEINHKLSHEDEIPIADISIDCNISKFHKKDWDTLFSLSSVKSSLDEKTLLKIEQSTHFIGKLIFNFLHFYSCFLKISKEIKTKIEYSVSKNNSIKKFRYCINQYYVRGLSPLYILQNVEIKRAELKIEFDLEDQILNKSHCLKVFFHQFKFLFPRISTINGHFFFGEKMVEKIIKDCGCDEDATHINMFLNIP